jgi:hypothetical protein
MGALLPQLKQLQLGQLIRAGAALLAYGGTPSKPWAGLWFVALQVTAVWRVCCIEQQLAADDCANRYL